MVDGWCLRPRQGSALLFSAFAFFYSFLFFCGCGSSLHCLVDSLCCLIQFLKVLSFPRVFPRALCLSPSDLLYVCWNPVVSAAASRCHLKVLVNIPEVPGFFIVLLLFAY